MTASVLSGSGVFQPLDPEFQRDPYPFYRAFRDSGALVKDGATQWIAARHEVVAALLRHDGLRSEWPEQFQALRMGQTAARDFLLRVVLHREGAAHTALRHTLSERMRTVPAAVIAERIAAGGPDRTARRGRRQPRVGRHRPAR